ncbi:MAG: hypothetical protein KAG06_07625 [Methylococcales bacterium]|nr:hypothetical protein [Methylococcales bacterium]
MRKRVLIPIMSLGRESEVVFLEIISEPAYFYGVNFQAIHKSGLTSSVIETKKILETLAYSDIPASHLQIGNHFLNLDSLNSVNLGLILSIFIQQKLCNYQKIIAIGTIQHDCLQLPLVGGDYLEAQLTSILKLGVQPEKVPLFFPSAALNDIDAALMAHLAKLNIFLKPVANAYQVLDCLGISADFCAMS